MNGPSTGNRVKVGRRRPAGSPRRPLAGRAALALLLCAGCASAGGGVGRTGEAADGSVATITNRNWQDVHAYVLVAGQRISLGMVTTNRTETFTLPPAALVSDHRLAFLIVPIGGRLAYVSDEVTVRPGDTVRLIVNNNLAQSILSVF